ncbi:hypothetical protein HWV62_24454 [Athelia sp. TMB]|nr:hypothetical protein HWV62_24454 [Athelia sp. TMB]
MPRKTKKIKTHNDNTGATIKRNIAHLCFKIPHVSEVMLANVDPSDVANFQQTCKTANNAVQGFRNVAFSITRFLERFLKHPDLFRAMQARTGTVIGGTMALAFFSREHHDDDSVDIYVNPGHSYEVARHLIDTQGYVFQPFGSQTPLEFVHGAREGESDRIAAQHHQESVYAINAIDHTFRFIKTDDSGEIQEIFLISTARSVLHAILTAASTASMNMLSFDSAISLYPRATFIQRENQELAWNTLHSRADIDFVEEEYESRGYPMASWRSRAEAVAFFITGKIRRLGDSDCWTIPFTPPTPVHSEPPSSTSPPITGDLLFENSWKLVGAGSFMIMKFCVISLPIFRYSYIVAEDGEAVAARDFYEDQWPLEKAAKCRLSHHQTWWDGNLKNIKEGNAQTIDYSREDSSDDFAYDSPLEVVAWDIEETLSTISQSSYLDVHPVLINNRMKKKTTQEILDHYRNSNEDEDDRV